MQGTRVTPNTPGGRPLIEKYGGGGFWIGGVRHAGSILVLGKDVRPWAPRHPGEIDAAALAAVLQYRPSPRILIIGSGRTFQPRPFELDEAVRAAGIGLEWMDTGAACRTFNVLLLEDREVAAALLAVE